MFRRSFEGDGFTAVVRLTPLPGVGGACWACISRIQRGDAYFAANVFGASGALLSVLIHFFEHGRWESLVETGVKEQSLTADNQLLILTQAALY